MQPCGGLGFRHGGGRRSEIGGRRTRNDGRRTRRGSGTAGGRGKRKEEEEEEEVAERAGRGRQGEAGGCSLGMINTTRTPSSHESTEDGLDESIQKLNALDLRERQTSPLARSRRADIKRFPVY